MIQHLRPNAVSVPDAAPMPVDAEALAEGLRRRIAGEVRFDEGSRALYATDASNYRQVPIGVVVPKSVDDVHAAIELCRTHQAPELSFPTPAVAEWREPLG
jgi:FAD/FMN-containing dehydrogenase